jgi:hypothetical protein
VKSRRIESYLILGISPSSRGVGFAVMEKGGTLIDWGVKTVKRGNKNHRSFSYAKSLICYWKPKLIGIEDTKASRRGPRIKALSKEILDFAPNQGVKVREVFREAINYKFLGYKGATKQKMAEFLASRFPEELGFRIPKRRRPWTTEGYTMAIFDAVALAVYFS